MDLNGDGRSDILSGSYSPGHIFLFAQKEDGTYAKGEKLLDAENEPVLVGAAAAAYAADWDEDGDYDLVIGNIQGAVHLVPNEGDAKNPVYGKPNPLEAGDQPIRVQHGDAGPAVADWDNDGLMDLIVGAGDGSVTWYRNSGERGKPHFDAGEQLISPAARGNDEKVGCGLRTKVCVADFNDDGLQDLLVGDFSSITTRPKAETDEDQKKIADAREQYERLMKQYQEAYVKTELPALIKEYREAIEAAERDEDKEANQKKSEELLAEIQEIQQGELRTMSEELQELRQKAFGGSQYHGYVWYFQRQSPEQSAAVQ